MVFFAVCLVVYLCMCYTSTDIRLDIRVSFLQLCVLFFPAC